MSFLLKALRLLGIPVKPSKVVGLPSQSSSLVWSWIWWP
jgi:hypothetical protein